MKEGIKIFLLKAPAILILIASFIGGLVVSITGEPQEISIAVPIILFLVLAAYFAGEYLNRY